MAKINLLPWRAERRKQRQQEFLTMIGVAVAAAALVSLLIVMYYNGQIDGQNNRNTYLGEQITLLDKQIAEIAELDKKKDGLLRRKKVIEELQASRSQMVHLFDELGRTIADGTQITSVLQNGAEMALLGRAQSNARVSTYMRNLERSGWMGNPDLSIIQLSNGTPGLPNDFSLKVTLKNPNAAPADGAPVDESAPAPAGAEGDAIPLTDPAAAAAVAPTPAPTGPVPAASAAATPEPPMIEPTPPPAAATGGKP